MVPFFFLFYPGLTVQGSVADIAVACFFGTACTVFASFTLHGLLGLKNIAWPLRLALGACSVLTIVPRLELQLGATVLGTLLLASVQLRGRPAKVDVSA